MADFIVDEEEDEHGQPVRRRRPKKRAGRGAAEGVNASALQEAQDIFGDVTELLEMDRRRREAMEAGGGDEDGAAGLDEEGEEGAEDDDTEGRRRARRTAAGAAGSLAKQSLARRFEPSVLEAKYMTERDEQIRQLDVPERMQLLAEAVGPIPAQDVADEAVWIFDRVIGALARPPLPELAYLTTMEPHSEKAQRQATVQEEVANVLEMMHSEMLEVPFIGMYRKAACPTLLGRRGKEDRHQLQNFKALWAICHWDKKWLQLQQRKQVVYRLYSKAQDTAEQDVRRSEVLERIRAAVLDAQSEQALEDLDAKFNLQFPPEETEQMQSVFKRPKKRTLYSVYRKLGLGSLAKQFGLTAEQLAASLEEMYKQHEVEDPTRSPEETAEQQEGLAQAGLQDVQLLLKGARHMAAVEIASEVAVREFVRSRFSAAAVVNVKPTAAGQSAIDAFHSYSPFKWLENKPLREFDDDDQWLLLRKGQDEGLLDVSVGMLPSEHKSLLKELENLYLSDAVSSMARRWNQERELILREAVVSILIPVMEREARQALASRAKQHMLEKYAQVLWDVAARAPYDARAGLSRGGDLRDRDEERDRSWNRELDLERERERDAEPLEEDLAMRVAACCWGPGNPATTFVMLNAAGDLVDMLHAGYLSMGGGGEEHQRRKDGDRERLLTFLAENQPHVVALGGANLQSKRLKDDIYAIIFKIVEDEPKFLSDEVAALDCFFVEETLAQLYERSPVSQDQLPGQPGIVRRAVALGRYIQNPLAMVASLCGPEREILSAKLHPLQDLLNRDEVYEMVERVMITISSQVGIDLNAAATHDWLFSPLQFVAGLGPRKAMHIQRVIKGAGKIATRMELLDSLALMQRFVFINAAGAMRVRASGSAASADITFEPLDDTRIHPVSYEDAKAMAEAVYCLTVGEKREDVDQDTLELCVEWVREHPDAMARLEVEDYVKRLEKEVDLDTLLDIKGELVKGYREWRFPYKVPTMDEEFYLLSGETPTSLAQGRVVQAKVKKVQQNRILCTLESGLLAVVHKEDLTDDRDADISDRVSEGAVVTGRIQKVLPSQYQVTLTCRGSELRSDNWHQAMRKDKYFRRDESVALIEEERLKKKAEIERRRAFRPRMIVHPLFQNVSLPEAMQQLEDKEVGTVILRPSSKGPDHLSLTLKFAKGVYTHIDIEEGGKDKRDATSFLRIGKTLTIGGESFEDIDEVEARYIEPLVGHLKEMLGYRKFWEGPQDEVDHLLIKEKHENPGRIPYYVSVSHKHPGAFVLSYIRMHSPIHEYISVSSKGFRFRKHDFTSPDRLVKYFQKHFMEPPPEAPPAARRAAAAMVPMSGPPAAPGGWHGPPPAPGGAPPGYWGGMPPPEQPTWSAHEGGHSTFNGSSAPWSAHVSASGHPVPSGRPWTPQGR
eukprot:SM000006S19365  [mRNA]  locus=s6:355783:364919:- [translate_table: standard]